MAERDPSEWMWQRAADLLERADKAQRSFFHLSHGASRPCWEPPVDVFENEHEIAIVVALPGVDEATLEIACERAEIVVAARRTLPAEFAASAVRRIEIPQGRFERRIALHPGRYALRERRLERGCLFLRIEKLP